MWPMQSRAREPVVRTRAGSGRGESAQWRESSAVTPLAPVFGEHVSVLSDVCLGWGCWTTGDLLLL